MSHLISWRSRLKSFGLSLVLTLGMVSLIGQRSWMLVAVSVPLAALAVWSAALVWFGWGAAGFDGRTRTTCLPVSRFAARLSTSTIHEGVTVSVRGSAYEGGYALSIGSDSERTQVVIMNTFIARADVVRLAREITALDP